MLEGWGAGRLGTGEWEVGGLGTGSWGPGGWGMGGWGAGEWEAGGLGNWGLGTGEWEDGGLGTGGWGLGDGRLGAWGLGKRTPRAVVSPESCLCFCLCHHWPWNPGTQQPSSWSLRLSGLPYDMVPVRLSPRQQKTMGACRWGRLLRPSLQDVNSFLAVAVSLGAHSRSRSGAPFPRACLFQLSLISKL